MSDFYNKYKLNRWEKFVVFLIIYHWIWKPILFVGISMAGGNIFLTIFGMACVMIFVYYSYSVYIVNILSFIFIIYCLLKKKTRKAVSYAWLISMIIFILYGYECYMEALIILMGV